jgi:hypothetical protein
LGNVWIVAFLLFLLQRFRRSLVRMKRGWEGFHFLPYRPY